MQQRPKLQTGLDKDTFLSFYYLKEELVSFCRENGLPSGGSKQELTERIALFLETGRADVPKRKAVKKAKPTDGELTLQTALSSGIILLFFFFRYDQVIGRHHQKAQDGGSNQASDNDESHT